MFGYLRAAVGALDEEQQLRYKACYCGLCRSLKARHGQLSRLTLTYDLSFLSLLLSALYEPEESSGEARCPAHPFSKRLWCMSEVSMYAADMNLALAYMKLRDNWDDDCDPSALLFSAMLKKGYGRVREAWPRQCAAIEQGIAKLAALEKSGGSADECAACFSALTAELFVYRDDRWAPELRAMGASLGGFIYVTDAAMDLEKDAKLCRFNPFMNRLGMADNGSYFADILRLYLADCVRSFERLPIVRDADIIRNILCLGLWAEFNRKYGTEKGPSDVSGPV